MKSAIGQVTNSTFNQPTGCGAIVRLTGQNILVAIYVGTAFDRSHLKTGFVIEAHFQRRVLAGELKLMIPGQLQHERFERGRLGRPIARTNSYNRQ